ncbi:MAG: hypothetical protein A2Y02_02885 [Omnitrophica bacterium GWA2_52_12]|nr:MAG: hypothetical protein A2Y02_02885 [Omnitrophica bacterium GWA2_52_12]
MAFDPSASFAKLREKNPACAYLLTGNHAVSRRESGLKFAQELLCEKTPRPFGCECPGCAKAATGNHADLFWLSREEEDKNIKIKRVRELIHWAAFKPYEARVKVAVIDETDRLSEEGAQALLKTLEEPPAATIFLLLAQTKFQLLDTIQSRCFHVRLKAPLMPSEPAAGPVALDLTLLSDYFEKAANFKKDKALDFFDSLMATFHVKMKASASSGDAPASLEWTEAVDAVYEAKEAVEGNTNPRIAVSFLSNRLSHLQGMKV